ncbi:DUF2606 family protein [Bacillus cereus]
MLLQLHGVMEDKHRIYLFYVKNKEKQPIKNFEIILMKDESPEPSKEIGISIGKTDEEGKVIWSNVMKGKYIIFLPNSKT